VEALDLGSGLYEGIDMTLWNLCTSSARLRPEASFEDVFWDTGPIRPPRYVVFASARLRPEASFEDVFWDTGPIRPPEIRTKEVMWALITE